MQIEAELKTFLESYSELLREMAGFINPLLLLSKEKRKEIEGYEKELEQGRKGLLEKFSNLPVPKHANAVLSDLIDYCTDLFVRELDYLSFGIRFSYVHEKFSLQDQLTALVRGSPIPGSMLVEEAYIYFKKTISLDWKFSSRSSGRIECSARPSLLNTSDYGEIECCHDSLAGSFWSKKYLEEGVEPVVRVNLGAEVIKKGGHKSYTGVEYARFLVQHIGKGEVDLFFKHCGL